MVIGLDSATPPTVAQVAAAKAAGIAVWSGYLSTAPFDGKPHFNLARPWSQAEFAIVKRLPGIPIAYTSGWDNPAGCKALAAAWGVRLCLDVEGGIRGDGSWVQPWLDAAKCGLYSYASAFPGRRFAFAIVADRSRTPPDPRATWPAWHPRPTVPCGWQWQGTHAEFGATVDRGWLDDWFGGAEMTRGQIVFDFMVAQLLAFGEIDPNPASQQSFVAAVEGGANPNDIFAGWYNSQQAKDYRARLAIGGKPPAFDATITPK